MLAAIQGCSSLVQYLSWSYLAFSTRNVMTNGWWHLHTFSHTYQNVQVPLGDHPALQVCIDKGNVTVKKQLCR
jgi:hypothetical protein